MPAHWVDEVHEEDIVKEASAALSKGLNGLQETGGRWTAWDDVTKCELDAEEVKKAIQFGLIFILEDFLRVSVISLGESGHSIVVISLWNINVSSIAALIRLLWTYISFK